MSAPSGQTVLAAVALVLLGALALVMVFWPVPNSNHDYMLILLGALAGALTVQGGSKIADKLTTSSGDNATIQPDAPKQDA